MALQRNLDVIYGDTDSIMINTGLDALTELDHVYKLGDELKKAWPCVRVRVCTPYYRVPAHRS